jgi:hypothetical protein
MKKLLVHAAVEHYSCDLQRDFHISPRGGSTCTKCHYDCGSKKQLLIHVGLTHAGLLQYLSNDEGFSPTKLRQAMWYFRQAEGRIYRCLMCPAAEYSNRAEAVEHVAHSHLDEKTREEMAEALRPQPDSEGGHTCLHCHRDVGSRLSALLHLERAHIELFGDRLSVLSRLIVCKNRPIERKARAPQQQGTSVSPGTAKRFTCAKCPNGWSSLKLSQLYRHYATKHYQKEICKKYGEYKVCPLCPEARSLPDKPFLLYHFGVAHNMVDELLEPQFRIPASRRRSRQRSKSKEDELLEPQFQIPASKRKSHQGYREGMGSKSEEEELLEPQFQMSASRRKTGGDESEEIISKSREQCCGSGSTCFWASWIL